MRKAIRVTCWSISLSVGLVLVAVFSFSGGAATQSPQNPEKSPPTTVKGERLEAELITLQEWGFEPKEIKRPAGPFVAVFQNRSGLREVKLSLVQASGKVMNKIPVTRHALNSRQRLQLPPGTYIVKEANHPDWECRIVVSQ